VRGGLHRIHREHEGDHDVKITVHEYDEYLSNATFLMAYAFLEEYLYLVWKRHAKDKKRGGRHRSSGMNRS
jgi:hypothetical protein